jgi:hypothetical protein
MLCMSEQSEDGAKCSYTNGDEPSEVTPLV